METARKIIEGTSLHNIKMKIDPGLLEWAATFGGELPEVLSRRELRRDGFNISQEYEPSMEATDINVRNREGLLQQIGTYIYPLLERSSADCEEGGQCSLLPTK